MGRLARKWMWRVVGVVAVSLAAAACDPGSTDAPSPEGAARAVPGECPHTWFVGGDSLNLAVVGPLTHIPEYHDCQRFISEDRQSYGPLAAIFRADSTLGQYFPPASVSVAPPSIGTGPTIVPDTGGVSGPQPGQVATIAPDSALPVAIILIDGDYEPLRLKAGFNCVYLWGALHNLTATIVSAGDEEEACALRLGAFDTSRWQELPVNVIAAEPNDGFTRDDIPHVARWDWDENHRYFFAISCGDYWCEVGSPDAALNNGGDFKGKPARRFQASDAAKKDRRVVRINLWYDQQHLAAATGPLAPTELRGTVFPHPSLGDHDIASFATWQPVAYVGLESAPGAYSSKYGWRQVKGNMANPLPVTAMRSMFTTVSFCMNTREACGTESVPVSPDCPADGQSWFARSSGPGRRFLWINRPVYKCVKYRGHVHGFDIPPVVRWRWRENDESLWVRCPQGCCEYDPT